MSQLEADAVGQAILFVVSDATTGDAVTNRTAANFTAAYVRFLRGIPLAATTTPFPALSDLAAWNSDFTPGGVKHLFNGIYILHVPNAVSVAGATSAMIDIQSDESADVVNVLGAVSGIVGLVKADAMSIGGQSVLSGFRMRQLAASDTNRSADVVIEEVTP